MAAARPFRPLELSAGGARFMRTFTDRAGQAWEVVAGRESWGAFFAIFVPGSAGRELRQTQLAAGSWDDAERELDTMDEAGLQDLLERSTMKNLG